MISLLLPTRQRVHNLDRFYKSAMKTADNPKDVEVVIYIDNDDPTYDDWLKKKHPRLTVIRGERIVLSEMWNACWNAAKGDIFGHMGDDIVFRSNGWDTLVKEAIDARPGKICFVWGNDFDQQSQRNAFGTHGFIHRNWTNITGRFVPPYFSSDYNDAWLNDVATALNVRTYIHEIHTEHMHYSLGKAEIDENTRERLERHERDNVEKIYEMTKPERDEEANKLREFINSQRAE